MTERKYKRGFLGCLVGVENWKDFGRAQVFSLLTHQNVLSHIRKENLDDFTATESVTFCPYIET